MAPTIEQLSAQLNAAQDALHKSERLAAVAQDAADGMNEAATPLEILTNLHYLILVSCSEPQKVLEYVEEAGTQALRLLEINGRILRVHKAAVEDAEKAATQFVM